MKVAMQLELDILRPPNWIKFDLRLCCLVIAWCAHFDCRCKRSRVYPRTACPKPIAFQLDSPFCAQGRWQPEQNIEIKCVRTQTLLAPIKHYDDFMNMKVSSHMHSAVDHLLVNFTTGISKQVSKFIFLSAELQSSISCIESVDTRLTLSDLMVLLWSLYWAYISKFHSWSTYCHFPLWCSLLLNLLLCRSMASNPKQR